MYYASKTEIERLDTVAVNSGLEVRQMMELAGFFIRPIFDRLGITSSRHVTVCVGPGNKGGDGLAAARQLMNTGYEVSVIFTYQSQLSADAAHQVRVLQHMEFDFLDLATCTDRENQLMQRTQHTDLYIDALVGYNLQSEPYGAVKTLINHMNDSQKPVVSYDVPTGMDSTKGAIYTPVISAVATLSLAIPKQAFQQTNAKLKTGRIFVGDLGIPDVLYRTALGIHRPQFDTNGVIEI